MSACLMHVSAPCVCGTHRGKERASGTLELNLKIVVSQIVVLETEPVFSAGVTSDFYHCSNLTTPSNYSNFK